MGKTSGHRTSSPRKPAPFPSKEAVLAFIRTHDGPVHKRELIRAFHLTAEDRPALKALLRDLEADGALEPRRGRRIAPPATLPGVMVLVVTGTDPDGEVLARPLTWPEEHPVPKIVMQPERRGAPSLKEGDRVLARLERLEDQLYAGSTLRRLEGATSSRLVGVYRQTRQGGRLRPTDRRIRHEFVVSESQRAGAMDGELVAAETLPASRQGLRQARVVERLGAADAPRAVSRIAIHAFGLPEIFPEAALREAAAGRVPGVDGREDLRALPLVTIDGADARDFDDAVWAQADPDPANPGGWHLIVAIADVAYYVRPGSALDRSAFDRGNSCYFPDRVVPMLPEALSNDLCSLRPGEDRGCLAAHLWIDREGRLRRHAFRRGLMRSAARLTYVQAQSLWDRQTPPPETGAGVQPAATLGETLRQEVLGPLYGAFAALSDARRQRGTLELDLPERQVHLDPAGKVRAIAIRPRYDSHRLIEEFMICANVAAAQALEDKGYPCLYRVHDLPSSEKLEGLREFLNGLGIRLARGPALKPAAFSQILAATAGRPESPLINEMVLRAQAQAIYSPGNIGHFGLALPRYAHFTSPIRRYADLVVHRALIRAYALGPGGLEEEDRARLNDCAEHISMTERRAAAAERDAVDRYTASYLAEQVGCDFPARISGVTRFGLFVRLNETGADGLIPVSTLPRDDYRHDLAAHALLGQRWGRVYRLGAPVTVRLTEADPVAGSLVFTCLDRDGADLPELAAALPVRVGRTPKDRDRKSTFSRRKDKGNR